jgi:hypothetical protein
VLLGDVDAEPALRGEVAPEGWARLLVGVEQRAGRRGRAVPLAPSTNRVVERDVLV